MAHAPSVDAVDAMRRDEQERALPDGDVFVSCPAPMGRGGLGRHLEEIVAALSRGGQRHSWIGEPVVWPGGDRRRPAPAALAMRASRPLFRRSAPMRHWAASVRFDSEAAAALPGAGHLLAFNGCASAQLRAARRRGYQSVAIVSATAHFAQVVRRHQQAYANHPVERPWSARLLARNLAEYRQADRIYVASRHVWESFVSEGYDPERLVCFPLTPHPRFVPSSDEHGRSTFDVVYTGSLSVAKGTPLLIEAFQRLDGDDLRLVLAGGWGTAAMRRYVQRACARDRRIEVHTGDPLERLQRARLYVHPSYSDGFSYGVAEALACGVPAVVTEDTGAKELIEHGLNGLVVPTGDADALGAAIAATYRGEWIGDGGHGLGGS